MARVYIDDSQSAPTPTPTPSSRVYIDDEQGNSLLPPTFGSEAVEVGKQGAGGFASYLDFLSSVTPVGMGQSFQNAVTEREMGQRGLSSLITGEQQQLTPMKFRTLRDVVDYYIGKAKPQTKMGRVAGTVAEYLPNAIGPGGVAQGTKAAVLAGLGAAAAREVFPDNPLAEAGAATLTPLSGSLVKSGYDIARRGVQAFKDMTSPVAARAAASNALREMVGDETGNVIQTLERGVDPNDVFGPHKMTAEVSGNRTLAALEKDIARLDPEAAQRVLAKNAARQSVRNDLITGDVPETAVAMPETARGAIIREEIAPLAKATKKKATNLYKAVDPQGTTSIPLEGAKAKLADALSEYLGTGGPSLKGEDAALIADFDKLAMTGAQPWDVIKRLESRATDIGGALKVQKENQRSAVVKALAGALKDATKNAAEEGVGMTAVQRNTALKADTMWRDLKTTYESGALGAALKKDKFGNFTKPDSSVASLITATPEAAKQFVKAAGGATGAKDAARGYLVGMLRDTGVTPKRFSSFVSQKGEELKTILGDEHAQNLKKVVDDLTSQDAVTQKWAGPSKGQSITAQKNTAELVREKALEALGVTKLGQLGAQGGAVGAGSYAGHLVGGPIFGPLGSAVGAMVGQGASWYAGKRLKGFEDLVTKQIVEAALEPQFAAELLKPQTQVKIENLSQKIVERLVTTTLTGALGAGKSIAGKEQEKPQKIAQAPAKAAAQPKQEKPLFRLIEPAEAAVPKKEEMPENDPTFEALLDIESSRNPRAVSEKGAQGLGQLMPDTGKEWASELGIKNFDPFNPEQNKKVSRYGLNKLRKQFDGDEHAALAAYHAGAGNVRKAMKAAGSTDWNVYYRHLGPKTRSYVPMILARRELYQKDEEA